MLPMLVSDFGITFPYLTLLKLPLIALLVTFHILPLIIERKRKMQLHILSLVTE